MLQHVGSCRERHWDHTRPSDPPVPALAVEQDSELAGGSRGRSPITPGGTWPITKPVPCHSIGFVQIRDRVRSSSRCPSLGGILKGEGGCCGDRVGWAVPVGRVRVCGRGREG